MAKTIANPRSTSSPFDPLRDRAERLGLHGLVASWAQLSGEPWIDRLLRCEEEARQDRSLQRRIQQARIGRFKSIADFDWKWPKKIDHEHIEEILTFEFLEEGANVILAGPNGVGKTMIAKNLAHQAVLRGHTALFTTASQLLNDLAAQETGSALNRRLRRYLWPKLLVIDEIGYLSAESRHADLLFEAVTRRYQDGGKPIVLTTNKGFQDWNEVFPSSGCVVALVDRLVHRSEIVQIEGESYRLKEQRERTAAKAKKRGVWRAKTKP